MGLTPPRPLLGFVECLLCHQRGAELRQGNNATAYLRCDACSARLMVSSRVGDELLRLLLCRHTSSAVVPVRIVTVADAADDDADMPRGQAPSDTKGPKRASRWGSSRHSRR